MFLSGEISSFLNYCRVEKVLASNTLEAYSHDLKAFAESQTRVTGVPDLEELRRRLIYSIIAMVVGFFACWGYAENIFSLMERPIMEALRRNGLSEKLVYLSPTEPFNLYLKIGLSYKF